MPTPSFNTVVITAASDPLTPVVAYSASRSENNTIGGDVQTYANGRRRAVAGPGVIHNFVLTLVDVSDVEETLPSPGSGTIVPLKLIQTDWLGVRVVFRDHRGRYFEGVYYSASIVDHKTAHLYDVAIAITELTPEGV